VRYQENVHAVALLAVLVSVHQLANTKASNSSIFTFPSQAEKLDAIQGLHECSEHPIWRSRELKSKVKSKPYMRLSFVSEP
jgi:hypothetical protein